MTRKKILLCLMLGLGSGGCATSNMQGNASPADVQKAAHVIVRSATIWGLLSHQGATPVVLAVNGQPHYTGNPRLQLDDSLTLLEGTHQIDVALFGSPDGHGLAQVEGRTCLQITAEANGRYVLRGAVEQANFRLDVLHKIGDREELVVSAPVSGGPSKSDSASPCAGVAAPSAARREIGT